MKATCEGWLAHADVYEGVCPRCGVHIFRRRCDETDEALKKRIKQELGEDK